MVFPFRFEVQHKLLKQKKQEWCTYNNLLQMLKLKHEIFEDYNISKIYDFNLARN